MTSGFPRTTLCSVPEVITSRTEHRVVREKPLVTQKTIKKLSLFLTVVEKGKFLIVGSDLYFVTD